MRYKKSLNKWTFQCSQSIARQMVWKQSWDLKAQTPEDIGERLRNLSAAMAEGWR